MFWILFFAVLFPLSDFILLFYIAPYFGLANTFFMVLISVILGLGIIKNLSQIVLQGFQNTKWTERDGEAKLIKNVIYFWAGYYFLVPGFATDAIALIILLPGFHQLLTYFLKVFLKNKIRQGVFKFGSNGANFHYKGGFTTGPDFTPMKEARPLGDDVIEANATRIDAPANNNGDKSGDECEENARKK